jgi:hypothetical protein
MVPWWSDRRTDRALRRCLLVLAAALPVAFLLTGPWRIGGVEVRWLTWPLGGSVLLALSAALVDPVGRRAAMHRILESDVTIARRWVWLAGLATGLVLARLTFAEFAALRVNAWDFSLFFDQPLQRTVHGEFLYSPFVGGCVLGVHRFWVLLLLVPLYALAASPCWLVAVQALAIAGAAVAAFFLFRKMAGDDVVAAAVAAGFVLNDYTARAVAYVFHPEILYPLALFILLWAYVERRPLAFAVAALGALSIKEDAVLVVGAFAVVAALVHRRPRWGVPLAIAAVAAFLVDTAVSLPHFARAVAQGRWHAWYWQAFGATPLAAAWGMAEHPLRLLGAVTRSGAIPLLASLAFVPVIGWEWGVAAVPALLVYGSADHAQLAGLRLYYSMPVLALLFAAVPPGLLRLSRAGVSRAATPVLRTRLRVAALAVLLVCAFDGGGYALPAARPERGAFSSLLSLVPAGTATVVQGALLPHAGYGGDLRVLDGGFRPSGREAVVLLAGADPFPLTRDGLVALIHRLTEDHRYRRFGGDDGPLLFLPARTQPDSPGTADERLSKREECSSAATGRAPRARVRAR